MSFTPGIPNTGQSLGFTKDSVRNNFLNYFDTISVNHVAPNVAGAGKHKFMQMPVQGSAPSTAATEGAIYAKTILGQSVPFYRKDASTLDYPMIPVRAMVRFTVPAAGACSIVGTALNVSGVNRALTVYTVTFSEAMSDANYLVFALGDNNLFVTATTTGSFSFQTTATLGTQIYAFVLQYVV